jgi:hypothetical protein
MSTNDIEVYHVDLSTSPHTITQIFIGVGFTALLDGPVLPSTWQLTLIGIYAGGLPATEELRVVRNTSMTQDSSFSQGDPFPESALELVADKAALVSQDGQDRANRALRGADSDPVSPELDLELPAVDVRASKYLTFDALGEPAATDTVTPGTEPISAAMSGFVSSATLANARNHIEVEKYDAGTFAARPAPGVFGVGFYYSTDTNKTYYSDGIAWVELSGIPSGLLAARPAFGSAGAFYYATDTFLLYYDTGAAWTVVRPDSTIPYSPGTIWGVGTTWQTATSFSVAVGRARDDLDSGNMLATAGFPMTKNLNAAGAWVLGGGNNAFPSGALGAASTWYRIFLMMDPTTGAVDWGCDTSATAANLTADQAAYTVYRRIGWVYVNSAVQYTPWQQHNDDWFWHSPQLGNDDAAPLDYTGGRWVTLEHTPPEVLARLNAFMHDTGVGLDSWIVGSSATLVAPANPTSAGTWAPPGQHGRGTVAAAVQDLVSVMGIWTDFDGTPGNAGRVRVRVFNDASASFQCAVEGWTDDRNRGGVI